MKVYLDLLKTIKEKGTYKAAAREGMPGTLSLFGYQFRHDLSEGFPLLTTKKLSFNNIVVELLWFLSGDTNIKYLVDNGCSIWNEDAYNYYRKIFASSPLPDENMFTFEQFVEAVKSNRLFSIPGKYVLGDCGKQYGWLWRNWGGESPPPQPEVKVDQIKDLIRGLRNNPMGRRHIISAWNPTTLNDMALNACHALVQFNCRPMSKIERLKELEKNGTMLAFMCEPSHEEIDAHSAPKYKLDCQMYQRSADVFLGVPYNIASYALLTHMLCKVLNMVPGEFIHTFGDVHIYENHMDQVDVQLSREPKTLPTYKLDYPCDANEFEYLMLEGGLSEDLIKSGLKGYEPLSGIKAKLSTGLQ